MDWTLISGFVALAALMVGLFRDVKRDTGKRYDDLRTEMREGFAHLNQRIDDTGKRIDDLRTEMRAGYARLDQRIDDTRPPSGSRVRDRAGGPRRLPTRSTRAIVPRSRRGSRPGEEP